MMREGELGAFRNRGGSERLPAGSPAGSPAGLIAGAPQVPGRGGERSPTVLSGAWCTAGKLEGNACSRRGNRDNAGNTPLLGVRQTRSMSAKG